MKAALILLSLVAFAQCFPGSKRETELSEEQTDSSNSDKDTDTVLVMPGGRPILPNFNRPSFGSFGLPSGFDDDDDDDSLYSLANGGFFRNPFGSNPFEGFLAGMESAMKRLRDQMSGIPDQLGFPSIVKLPEGANTTSTVKIIDGHVVTINETTYTDGDDKSGTVFRVRVVEVKPQNETTAVAAGSDSEGVNTRLDADEEDKEEATTQPRSVESVEEFDNEIPKNQQDNLNA